MNLKVLFYFTLAVSSCFASKFDPNTLIKGIGKKLPQPLQKWLHLFPKGNSTVLDYDTTHLIFEQLEFKDLLTIAETNKDLSFLAARAFANKFGHINIRIGNFSYSKPPNRIDLASKQIKRLMIPLNLDKLSANHDSIQIQSVFFGMKTLKHFGKYIQKLELSFENADSKAAKIISKYVDDYCSDNLVELKLEFNEGDALRNFKNTFNHVEKLHFIGKTGKKIVKLPTNRTFPVLRSFSFEGLSAGFEYKNGYFPHLEHLSISPREIHYIGMLEDLLNANANIRSFECIKCKPSLVRYAGTKLLNAENLVLNDLYTDIILNYSQLAHFENVTKAKLNSIKGSPEISLPKLQDLEVDFDSWHIDTLISFLRENSNLSRLHLMYRRLDYVQFDLIIPILPNLEELSISNRGMHYNSNIDGKTTIELLKKHSRLIKFKTDFCSRNDKIMLRNSLKDKWHIEDYDNGLSFKRKE